MLKLLFILILTSLSYISADLETVQDEELMNLIKNERYVIVLFSKRYCEQCENYENELSSLREDLVETLNAWVVKVVDSQLTRLYSPDREPALVFFRYGIPLLYHGQLNDERILHVFTANKEPLAKELTDETFEHLTQSASGATTGDWFVMFYTPDCIDCQRLQARWEAVGAEIKTRTTVARVNRATTGAATARRFGVFHVPAFILFHQGKMYRYQLQKYDVTSFVAFAQNFYKNMKAENVPSPKTPFDDFLALVVDYLRQNEWLYLLGGSTFLIGLLAALILRRQQNKQPQQKAKSKKGAKEK